MLELVPLDRVQDGSSILHQRHIKLAFEIDSFQVEISESVSDGVQVLSPTRESSAMHGEITVAVVEGFWVQQPDG